MSEVEKSLDAQLWHACAGEMVQMPLVNSRVYYFPQGHAEHSQDDVDFGVSLRIPGFVLCRVVAIKFLAEHETDEVYVKLRLLPVRENEFGYSEDGVLGSNGSGKSEKMASFPKTLTQSDANNGGGFSVPRYCAQTIFPPLDYSVDLPLQTLMIKDVHGEIWNFRHIYRGTPRRHLLTTGWSRFVNEKKLVAGDSVVFLKADNGDLCVGIRRAKRVLAGGIESIEYGGISMLSADDENRLVRNVKMSSTSSGDWRGNKRVKAESVVEAASLAANGHPFDIVYYPRAGTPEFCVKESAVEAAMRTLWVPSSRFKMAFETEDSSRTSWLVGTISAVQFADPIHWPNSPWRLLQVTWDEPDLLQNISSVSPWLVELVSTMPIIPMSHFSPPTKKLRLPQHSYFPLDGPFIYPSLGPPISPLSSLSDNIPAGIQGARHSHFEKSLSDHHFNSKLQTGFSGHPVSRPTKSNGNTSCLLTIGTSSKNLEKSDTVKKPKFLLFGQPILTEQQMSPDCSSDEGSQVLTTKCSIEEIQIENEKVSSHVSGSLHPADNSGSVGSSWKDSQTTEHRLEPYQCMVYMESNDVGQTLDLSLIGSYKELYRRLDQMFGFQESERLTHVLYQDAAGNVKRSGDESFSIFAKTAKILTILKDAGSNIAGRQWNLGQRNDENGIHSANKPGQLSIFG